MLIAALAASVLANMQMTSVWLFQNHGEMRFDLWGYGASRFLQKAAAQAKSSTFFP